METEITIIAVLLVLAGLFLIKRALRKHSGSCSGGCSCGGGCSCSCSHQEHRHDK